MTGPAAATPPVGATPATAPAVPRVGHSSGSDVWDPPLAVIVDILAGLFGAVAALVHEAGSAVWAVWLQDRPRRRWRRTLRRNRWRYSRRRGLRTLLWIERGLVVGWLTARSTVWVLFHLRAGWRGARTTAAAGWRAGVDVVQRPRRSGHQPSAQPTAASAPGGARSWRPWRAIRHNPPATGNGGGHGGSAAEPVDVEVLCTWTGPRGATCPNAVDAGELLCPAHGGPAAGDSNGAGAATASATAGGARPVDHCVWVLEGGRICDQPVPDGELFCAGHPGPSSPAGARTTADGQPTRRWDGEPETDADRRFFALRESGYEGWIDSDGYAVDGPPLDTSPPAAAANGADAPVACPWCHGRPGASGCEFCGGEGTVPAWVVDPAHGVRAEAPAGPQPRPRQEPPQQAQQGGAVEEPRWVQYQHRPDALEAAEDRWSVEANRCRYVVTQQLWGPGRRMCGRPATVQVNGLGAPHRFCDEHFRKIHGTTPGASANSETPDADSASGPAAASAAPAAPSPTRTSGGTDLMATSTTTTTTVEKHTTGTGIAGELANVDDLSREGLRAAALLEQFEELGRQLKRWSTTLPDRYAQAPFGTKALTAAVNGIAEHHRHAGALKEQLGVLQKACGQARALGDHVASVRAEGDTAAYTPQ